MTTEIKKAAEIIKNAKRVTAFTGAGISVESGIPPFRGEGGLWNKYDPIFLDLDYFYANPEKSWGLIKKIFYDFFGKAKPNAAHFALAKMEEKNLLYDIITQNIDNLHQEAGSKNVIEFHGTSQELICAKCDKIYKGEKNILKFIEQKPYPKCETCGGILKPNFIFFGEPIPPKAYQLSIEDTEKSDVFLVVGTSGEVQPASMIPYLAKKNNAIIIEINIKPSNYTYDITDVFLQGKATEISTLLLKELNI